MTVSVARPELTPFWSAQFTDRRIAPALGLGFTSGIPFLLVYSTQSAWLSDVGISLVTRLSNSWWIAASFSGREKIPFPRGSF